MLAKPPFVVRQVSHTAIVVHLGTKNAQLIRMDKNLSIESVPIAKLDQDWKQFQYPVHKAALSYMLSSQYLGATSRAFLTLKEIVMQYIISTAGEVLAALPNKKEAAVELSKLPEEARLDAIVVGKEAELEKLEPSALVALYNSLAPEGEQVPDTTKAETWAAMEARYNDKVQKRAATRAAKGDRGASKTQKVVDKLKEGPVTLAQLVEASGYDEVNARTCIGILRNRKGMEISYDRASQLYTLKAA